MANELFELKEEIIEDFMRGWTLSGCNPTILRIYFTLFLSDNPMGLSEISKETGYSKSTVCTSMEVVERLFDIHKFKRPGSKKIFWKCTYDPEKMFKKQLELGEKILAMQLEALNKTEKRLKEVDGGQKYLKNIGKFKKHFENHNKMYEFIREKHKDILD
ncbi:MAG: hypothetical protein ABH851_03805 [Methanobacteriota archaeon]